MSTSTSTSTSSTTHDAAIIIETAVPLLQRRRQQHPCEKNDTTVDNDDVNSSRNNTTTSTVWGWNLYLFVIGILCGIVLLCLSLLSLVVMLQRYGDNENDNESDDTIMPALLLPTTTTNTTDNNSGNPLLVYREQIIYVTLYCLSYLWEIFFPIICGIFFCILSSNVRAKQILQTITGGRGRQLQQQQQDIDIDDDDHVHSPTSVAYVMIVSLQGGFLVGCRCVGLAMEVYLGLPLSLVSFIGTIIVDLLVCSLVIKCFEWSKHNIAILEKREEEQQKQQEEAEQCSYIAIV